VNATYPSRLLEYDGGFGVVTGTGMEDFFEAVSAAAVVFEKDYLPDLLREKARKEAEEAAKRKGNMTRLMRDMTLEERGGGGGGVSNPDMDVASAEEG